MYPYQNHFQFKSYSKRKTSRPISIRDFNHVILKSRIPLLRLNHHLIQTLLIETQRRFKIHLRGLAIMPDHVHLVVKVETRKQWADSLRFLTGQFALKLKRGKLWAERVWSRTVKAGRDYRGVVEYVFRNPFKAGIEDLRIDSLWIMGGILFGKPSSPPPYERTPEQEVFSF